MSNKRDILLRDAAETVNRMLDFEDGAVLDVLRQIVAEDTDKWTIGDDSAEVGNYILFSDHAKSDLEWTVLTAEETWGCEIAKRYLDYLRQSIVALSNAPEIGDAFDPLPGWYAYIPVAFSFRKAGQMIVYRPIKDGIAIAFLVNVRGPHLNTLGPPKIHAIMGRHVVGPAWAGCDPDGKLLRFSIGG